MEHGGGARPPWAGPDKKGFEHKGSLGQGAELDTEGGL